MCTPGNIVTFAPIQHPSSIFTGLCTVLLDALWKLDSMLCVAVVISTLGAINTLSPIVIFAFSFLESAT